MAMYCIDFANTSMIQTMQLQHYHLAQVNIATLRAPLHDPQMADFVAQINYVNSIADTDPGFVWRLRAEGADDATNIRAFDDDRILITLTVWKSLEALSNYVYRGAHAGVMRDRRRWFEKGEHPILALWWVPVGHNPTVEEGKERLDHLRCQGSTAYAFSFGKPFPSPIKSDFHNSDGSTIEVPTLLKEAIPHVALQRV